jgi:hypothetical protein
MAFAHVDLAWRWSSFLFLRALLMVVFFHCLTQSFAAHEQSFRFTVCTDLTYWVHSIIPYFPWGAGPGDWIEFRAQNSDIAAFIHFSVYRSLRLTTSVCLGSSVGICWVRISGLIRLRYALVWDCTNPPDSYWQRPIWWLRLFNFVNSLVFNISLK